MNKVNNVININEAELRALVEASLGKALKSIGKTAGAATLGAAGMLGMLGLHDEIHKNDKNPYEASPEVKKELRRNAKMDKAEKDYKKKNGGKTMAWDKATLHNHGIDEGVIRNALNKALKNIF